MRRSSAWLLGSLAALAGAAGCGRSGTLHVSWDFLGTEPASSGCGQHGVDSVVIAGADTAGDGIRVVTACTPGFRDVTVAEGTWTATLAMLNAQGLTMTGADASYPSPTGTATVSADAPGAVSVHLDPAPACNDGVDNDGDGRVDTDDPDCQGDPNGTAE
jgi:hypothetical protein